MKRSKYTGPDGKQRVRTTFSVRCLPPVTFNPNEEPLLPPPPGWLREQANYLISPDGTRLKGFYIDVEGPHGNHQD